ncbi:MAG: 2-succinyl-5-enolpyruvyl-6-hydroxy-3-cyclohexene-1-carboxylic-acid synthase [Akkermansia sp.]
MRSLIAQCCLAGVAEWIICPGARNVALLQSLAVCHDLVCRTHFDERSAGFFALGRIQELGLPVAVVTTSGTAAAELYPSIIEAYYQGRPLVVITADRPASFRGSGAPQAIEQVDMFGIYATTIDIENSTDIPNDIFDTWDWCSPLHLNICLGEPDFTRECAPEDCYPKQPPAIDYPHPVLTELAQALRFQASRGLVVIIGGLDPDEQEPALWLAKELKAPVLADATSGIREELSDLCLCDGDAILAKNPPPMVLRLGDIPVGRFWRDLEQLPQTKVFSITRTGLAGLARDSHVIHCSMERVIEAIGDISSVGDSCQLFPISRKRSGLIEELLTTYSSSEQALIHAISINASMADLIYLGNSSPIRLWNDYAQSTVPTENVRANRGANGIDGQISGFLGNSIETQEAWAILGDLTTMYDANALSLCRQLPESRRVIVILNNHGGGIFRHMKGAISLSSKMEQFLVQPQQFDFQQLANLWNAHYLTIDSTLNLDCLDDIPEKGLTLIELCPDEKETVLFEQHLRATRPNRP